MNESKGGTGNSRFQFDEAKGGAGNSRFQFDEAKGGAGNSRFQMNTGGSRRNSKFNDAMFQFDNSQGGSRRSSNFNTQFSRQSRRFSGGDPEGYSSASNFSAFS